MDQSVISTPKEFSFERTLEFLLRSPRELLHRVDGKKVLKVVRVETTPFLFSLEEQANGLLLSFINGRSSASDREKVILFVREWLDLDSDLKPFYTMARKDDLLAPLVKKFYGYRIIGQPDLFESLVWAVLGQQINLGFAYTLKQRFVEKFGDSILVDQERYHLFPLPPRVATLTDSDLLPLQFSRQKSKYTVLIAEAFANGTVSKEKLRGMPLQQAKEELMKIKGVGNWTANYALMKTFRYPDAFPLEDAGLHNAIKNQLSLKAKPSLERVRKIFKKYKGWEAYATLYLWKSL